MADFWLNKSGHACYFVSDINDVVAVSPPGSWRLESHKGTAFPDDYRLRVTRKSASSGTLQVINPVSNKVSLDIEVGLWRASDGPHKGQGHFFVSDDETVFLFRYTNPIRGPGVLAQLYVNNGSHWASRPTTDGALTYEAPLAGVPFASRVGTDDPKLERAAPGQDTETRSAPPTDSPFARFIGAIRPFLERPTPTQDDEGGGYVP